MKRLLLTSVLVFLVVLSGCRNSEGDKKSDAEYVSECKNLIKQENEFISLIGRDKVEINHSSKGFVTVGGIPYLAAYGPNNKRERWAKCLFPPDGRPPFVAYRGFL